MNEERIFLSARENKDGELRVYDQHGREVAGLTSLDVRVDVDAPTHLLIGVHDMRDGKMWVGGRKPKK